MRPLDRCHGPPPESLLPLAVASELVLLMVFIGVPALSNQLGGAIPTIGGWLLALLAVPAVIMADTLDKLFQVGHPRIGDDSSGSSPGKAAADTG